MELRVEQQNFKLNYEYHIYNKDELIFIARANRTILPKFRRIFLYNPSKEEIGCLKQESLLPFALEHIPLLSFVVRCPFNLYLGGVKKGFVYMAPFGRWNRANAIGILEGRKITFYLHTGNDVSIFEDGQQIALITRNAWKEWDGDKYKVLFNTSVPFEIAALFVIFTDILWYTNDRSVSQVSWESSKVFDEHPRDKNWSPTK